MHADLTLSTGPLGFLLTLARVAGIFVFVPMPGMKGVADMARIVLTLAITLCVFPQSSVSAKILGPLLTSLFNW